MAAPNLILLRRIVLSAAAGLSISIALALQFFAYDDASSLDRFFLLFVPALSITACVYYLLPFLEESLNQAAFFARIILLICALFSVFIALFAMRPDSIWLFIAAGISLFAVFFAAVIPSTPYFQKIMETGLHVRLFFGWLFSTFVVFIALGFLDNFYSKPFEIFSLTLVFQLLMGQAGFFLAGRIKRFFIKGLLDFAIVSFLFLLLFVFAASIFGMGKQFPGLFIPDIFTLKSSLLPVFLIASVLLFPWQAWGLHKLKSTQMAAKLKETKIYDFVGANIPGILLALAFFSIYILIASMLNNPQFDVDDIFFDADTLNWRLRLTTDNWQDYYWRSVHPFVLLLLKPPIDLAALLLKGDKLFGAYIVVAAAGALSIFLTWKIVERITHNTIYALLTASLLGLSASHLIFGSLIETYIFLAASLLLFYLFLVEDRPFPAFVLAGLASIGITYTNFAQNVIAFFSVKPNIKLIFRYVASVLALLVLLSLMNNLIYPGAQPFFFIPSALLAEEQNIFPLNMLRIQALARAFLFHNVVAPTPILYTGDIPFTQFRFFKPEINRLSEYDTTLQTFTAWFWLGLILLGIAAFFINYKKYKSNRLTLALLGGLLLNFGLHLRYGKELFLYSPNWTYALILLLALAWQGFSKYRWFQVTLLIFLVFLAINNRLLLNTIFSVLNPYLN